jgi:hypothetical protein
MNDDSDTRRGYPALLCSQTGRMMVHYDKSASRVTAPAQVAFLNVSARSEQAEKCKESTVLEKKKLDDG